MKSRFLVLGLSFLVVAGMLLASCAKSTPTSTPTPMPSTTEAVPVVLTVANGSKIETYSLTDLQDGNVVNGSVINGYGGQKGMDGTITGPYPYQGVALTDLLNAVGGITEGQSVKITASSGYSETLSYDQIINGNFNIYDTSGNSITTGTKPIFAVVFMVNGNLLDNTTGPIELGILSNLNFITDESMWVKMVNKIEIITAQ